MTARIVSFLTAVLLLLGSTEAVLAGQATPESGLADLGLPELVVTVTGTGFEGIPAELAAGRYLLTVNAASDIEYGGGVAFVQPVGVTPDEFLSALAGPPPEAGGMAGTPTGAADLAEGTPEEGAGMEMALPPFIIDSIFAGGTFALAGQSAQIVLDLPPGAWIAWGDDPVAPQEPVIFEVTGEMPTDLPEPASSATLAMSEYAITVSAGALQAGPQVVKVENIGAQPHFIFIAQGPDDMTEEQVAVVLDEELAAGESGTPPAYSDLNPEEDLVDIAGTGTQSRGTTQWVPVTLEPGTYAMVCFFPDLGDGLPHAFHGMYAVLEVAE